MWFLVGANQLGPMMEKSAQSLFFTGDIKEVVVSSFIPEKK
jgi:hypothetical protein